MKIYALSLQSQCTVMGAYLSGRHSSSDVKLRIKSFLLAVLH